jgi:hypothetical protein
MKKYSWIMALLLALTLAFIGCPTDGGGDGGGGDPKPEPPEGGGIQWGDEPGMKPTMYGESLPTWSDENGGIMTIKGSSSTGFTWTWAELSEAAGEEISRDTGNLFVFYVIEVIKPAAALTFKNPGAMANNPGAPAGWGQGKGSEYVLGHNTLSNYQKGGGNMVGGLYNSETGRGWFEIDPTVYAAGSTGVGFQHNFWCDMGGVSAENSEYKLKIISISLDVPDLSVTVNLAEIPGVTVPIKDQVPVTAITDTPQYTGTIAWTPAVAEGGTFATDTAYTATITLTAKEGFTFTGVAEDFFTVTGATATNPADSGVVTAVFPKTAAEGEDSTVTESAIVGVTAPAGGTTPVSAITAGTQIASGTVAWSPAVTGTFEYATISTATIELTDAEGFTFDGVAADFFTVTGATATNPADSGVVTAVFPATGPAPIIPSFTIDADAGTATHDNFVIVNGLPAHGGFSGTDNGDGSFTIISGGIRYEFPETATGFTLADYDFVEFEYTASDVANIVLKKFTSSGDFEPLSGSVANTTDDPGKVRFELRYADGGFAIQKWQATAKETTIAITKITFIKGTRYSVTYDSGDDDIPNPTTPAFFVGGTKVGNTLPPLPHKEGFVHTGWTLGESGPAVTAETAVDSSFEDAVLTAVWKVAVEVAPQTVVFSTDNLFAVGDSARNTAGEDEEPNIVDSTPEFAVISDGAGYSVTTHNNGYGNSWVYFTYTFTDEANFSDYTQVTFKFKGLSGDIGYKTLYVVVMEDTDMAGLGNYISFQSKGADTPIESHQYNDNGQSEVELVLAIDPGKAAALDGKTLGIAIGVHGNDYGLQITDFVFSQGDE